MTRCSFILIIFLRKGIKKNQHKNCFLACFLYKISMSESKRIIVVEDEKPALNTVTFLLRGEGHSVLPFDNGEHAFRRIKRILEDGERIDLIITDLQMPGQDGLSLIDNIQKLGCNIPIIVITGYGSKEILIELLRKGCVEYLDKPFGPDQLLDKVNHALRIIEERDEQGLKKELHYKRELDYFIQDNQKLSQEISSIVTSYQNLVSIENNLCSLDLAYKSRPFSLIGGDFLFTRNSHGYSEVFVGDIAGHDMGTAFYTIQVKEIYEESRVKEIYGAEFLRYLNQRMLNNRRKDLFLTLVLFRLNCASGEAEILIAGHPSPLFYHDQQFEILKSGGSVIGITEQVELQEHHFKLQENQAFYIFTDGLMSTKIKTQKEKLGEKGIASFLEKHKGETIKQSVEKTFSAIYEESGKHFPDDAMLVGIEYSKRFNREDSDIV